MRQARPCGRVRAPGPAPSAPKQLKLDACQREIAIDEIQEIFFRESSYIKACQCTDGLSGARVGVLMGSAPRKMT